MNNKFQAGFNLIELMIVVVIISILAAIAFPAYQESVNKSRRADAQGALYGLASAMERYFTLNNTYTGTSLGTTAGDIFNNQVPVDGGAKYYDLSVTAATTTTYTISAVRTGMMGNDKCGDYTLTNTNAQGLLNNTAPIADCWR